MRIPQIEKFRSSKALANDWTKAPTEVFIDKRLSPYDRCVYQGVAVCVWKHWETSQQFVSEITSISVNQVRKSLRRLVTCRYLTVQAQSAGISAVYSLTFAPIRRVPCLRCAKHVSWRSTKTGWCHVCMKATTAPRKAAQVAS